MDHQDLLETAAEVAYFGDLRQDRNLVRGLSIRWHERERLWLVAVADFSAVISTESLREFAESGLDALDNDGDSDQVLFADSHGQVCVSAGINSEYDPYFQVELYSTGADDHPTEVHHHWLDLEEPDVDNLKAGYHALLTRLDPTKYPKPKPTAEQPDPVVVHDSTSQGTTRHEALLRSAEVVAYFGDVTLHGQVPMKGLSVLWHEQERLWLVEVPGHFGGPTSAELLQEFARGGRASMNNNGYHSGQLYRDDYVSAQLESGVTEATGAYVTIYAYLDTTRDFLGVSDHGEGLYSNRYGAGLLEFRLDRPDRDRLKSAFRTLHRRLATAGPDTFADHQPTVMATFTRPGSNNLSN
ncbi:hypothetical protein ACFQ1S_25710, partial [Kibdelosporangium lantanae]